MDELSEIMRKNKYKDINIATRILVVPIRTFFLIYLLIKKYIGDYIKRPHDMEKEEYIGFHAAILFYFLFILILILIDPIYLLVLYFIIMLIGGFKK